MKRISKKLFTLLLAVMVIASTFTMPVSAATVTPGTPTLVSATSSAYNKVTVTWKKASNATKYRIYYKRQGSTKWVKLADVKSGVTSYTHIYSKTYPFYVGEKLTYTVKAYNSSSKKWGGYKKAGIVANTTPNAVTLVSAKANSKKTQVTLTWKAAKGCNYYRIYRKVAGGKWATIANVPSSQLTYVDKAPVKGKTNVYTVRGYYSKTKVLSAKYNKTGLSVNLATSSPHTHSYGNATCTKPATCSCGATNGNALGHDFGSNNKTCSRCGTANPNYVAPQPVHQHSFSGGNCVSPATCSCGATGNYGNHNWVTTKESYMLCTCGYISYDGNDMSMHTILNGCPGWCHQSTTTTTCSICGAQQ